MAWYSVTYTAGGSVREVINGESVSYYDPDKPKTEIRNYCGRCGSRSYDEKSNNITLFIIVNTFFRIIFFAVTIFSFGFGIIFLGLHEMIVNKLNAVELCICNNCGHRFYSQTEGDPYGYGGGDIDPRYDRELPDVNPTISIGQLVYLIVALAFMSLPIFAALINTPYRPYR